MTLDNFRTQKIIWDKANKKIFEAIEANAGDSNGRKLVVQIINQEVTESLSGTTLTLGWKSRNGAKGLDVFNVVDAPKGIFEIYYTTEMLSNIGNLEASLILIDSTSRIESSAFTISVRPSTVDDESVESENSFTALTEALVKVNDFDAQLAETLKKGKVSVDDIDINLGKITPNMVSDELLAQIAGDAPVNAVPGPRSITRDKVALGAISSQETDFLSGGGISRNLFDKSNAIIGYRIDSQDKQTLVEDANFACTDYIPVIPGSDIYKNKQGALIWYTEDKVPIGGYGNGEMEVTHRLSASAYYVRLNLYLDDIDTYQLEYGTEGTEYEEYGDRPVYLKPHVLVGEENIPSLEIPEFEIEDETITPYKTTFISGGRNLFDKDKRLVNQYWNLSGGVATLESIPTLDTAEPIPVEPGEIYYKNRKGHIAFLTSEFGIVSSTTSNAPAGVYTVPNYATQMVFNVYKEDVEEYQIELGDHETEYDDGKLKLSTDIKIAPESLPPIKVVGENTPKYYKINAAGDFTVYLPITSEEYVSYRFSRNTLENYMKLNQSGIYTKIDSGFAPKFDITENSSNKEFAINVSDEGGGAGHWFPQHNNIGTVFITNDGLQEFMVDGEIVSLETPTVDFVPFDTAKFSQISHAKKPTDESDRARITISYEFTNVVKQYFEIEFLMNTMVNAFYAFMLPLRQIYLEKVKTNRREIVYAQATSETTNTYFNDLSADEFIATSINGAMRDYYVRAKITNQSHELESLFLEHRQSQFQKLYPQFASSKAVLAGEKFYVDGEYEIGKLINANKVYG